MVTTGSRVPTQVSPPPTRVFNAFAPLLPESWGLRSCLPSGRVRAGHRGAAAPGGGLTPEPRPHSARLGGRFEPSHRVQRTRQWSPPKAPAQITEAAGGRGVKRGAAPGCRAGERVPVRTGSAAGAVRPSGFEHRAAGRNGSWCGVLPAKQGTFETKGRARTRA